MKHRRFARPYPPYPEPAVDKVAGMRAFVEAKLTEIHAFFTGDVKVTFIARFPGFPEQDVLISSDTDLDGLAALIERSRKREEVPRRPPPTSCGYCSYEESDGELLEQCVKCKAADALLRR